MFNDCNHDKKHFPTNCFFVGATGPTGPAGPVTVTVGTTTTGEPETMASVTNSGSAENVILDFVIPGSGGSGATGPSGETRPTGESPTFEIDTVTTGAPGTNAQVTIT